MIGLTIVCALVAGYLTGIVAGGGALSPTGVSATLPTIGVDETVVVDATSEPAPSATAVPQRTATPTVSPTRAASPTPTVSPTATSTAQPQPTVFIQETFDTAANGWPTGETETWSAGYADQRYQLKLSGQTSIGFTTELPADNYRLSVDVAVSGGGAGVVFLFAEPATTYRIIVAADGAYALERQEGNATTNENIVTKIIDWTESPALLKTPGAANRLMIERQGQKIRFMANDQPLTDFTVPPGPFVNRYGFVLTARDGQGAATFDNLRGERLPNS
jgi:hypothetical protein